METPWCGFSHIPQLCGVGGLAWLKEGLVRAQCELSLSCFVKLLDSASQFGDFPTLFTNRKSPLRYSIVVREDTLR